MDRTPYAPPAAPVRDLQPEDLGPVPDWAAVLIGLVTNKFLAMVVADELSSFLAAIVTEDEALEVTFALTSDLGLTYCAELFAFWMALRICRSRSFWVVIVLAAISWAITFADRWVLNDHGWPFWYEMALLSVPVLAFISVYVLYRQRASVA